MSSADPLEGPVPVGSEYNFPVPYGEIPERPEKLFIPEQLEKELEAYAEVPVSVNKAFRTTVARARRDALGPVGEDHLGPVRSIEVSWEAFRDADAYGGDGWALLVSAVNAAKAGVEPSEA